MASLVLLTHPKGTTTAFTVARAYIPYAAQGSPMTLEEYQSVKALRLSQVLTWTMKQCCQAQSDTRISFLRLYRFTNFKHCITSVVITRHSLATRTRGPLVGNCRHFYTALLLTLVPGW